MNELHLHSHCDKRLGRGRKSDWSRKAGRRGKTLCYAEYDVIRPCCLAAGNAFCLVGSQRGCLLQSVQAICWSQCWLCGVLSACVQQLFFFFFSLSGERERERERERTVWMIFLFFFFLLNGERESCMCTCIIRSRAVPCLGEDWMKKSIICLLPT